MNQLSGKKRKGANGSGGADDLGVASSVKVENDANPTILTEDNSNYSPVERILIVDLLKDDSQTILNAFEELANIISDANEDSRAEICSAVQQLGGATLISGNMKKWRALPNIQAEGCRVLNNVSITASGIQKSAIVSKVLDAIVWAMTNYSEDERVQTMGCGAIANLIRYEKANSEYIVNDLKGLDLIIAAMKKYKDVTFLQWSATRFLYNVLKWDDIKQVLSQPDHLRVAMEVLSDALVNHRDESKESVRGLRLCAKAALAKLVKAL